MFSNDVEGEQGFEKADAEQLQLPEEGPNFPETNGNPKEEPHPNTHLPYDSDHTSDDSLRSFGNGDFPEGGARAWSVVAGAAGIIFCSLGYCNAFGYDSYFFHFPQQYSLINQ